MADRRDEVSSPGVLQKVSGARRCWIGRWCGLRAMARSGRDDQPCDNGWQTVRATFGSLPGEPLPIYLRSYLTRLIAGLSKPSGLLCLCALQFFWNDSA